MKQLLYIGRPNLGENLFATPCLELLSKNYEITLVTPKFTFPIFKNYSFINSLLPRNLGTSSNIITEETKTLLRYLTSSGEWYSACHHDYELDFLKLIPELSNLKQYPVLIDKQVNACSNAYRSRRHLSRTRKYMLKLQLMSLQDTINYDCTIRCPTFISENKNKKVVVYEGSTENLRKLPIETMRKFMNVQPDAVYLVNKKTAESLEFNKNKIQYIPIDRSDEESMQNIIKLFESHTKVLIGPDAGLTQLAIGYKIPLIWLQSRVWIDWIIDYQYRKCCKVYFKKELSCKQNCQGCVVRKYIKDEISPTGEFFLPEHVHSEIIFKNLECRDDPVCLNYSDAEVREIVQMID
jgi:hypothetical protein